MKKLIVTIILTCCFIGVLHAQQQLLPIKQWNKSFNREMCKLGYSLSEINSVNKIIAKFFSMENQHKYIEAAEYGVAIHKALNDNAFSRVLTHTELYAYILNHISNDYNKVGAYAQALYFGLEAEKCWGNLRNIKSDKYVNLMYVIAINNLASFYYTGNDGGECEKWLEKGLQLTKDIQEYEGYYYNLLDTKACYYNRIGRTSDALKLGEEIMKNATYIKNHWRINFIQYKYGCGKIDEAISDMLQLLNEYRLHRLDETYEFADLLTKLGLYYEDKDIEKSISLTQESIDVLKRNNDTLNTKYAQSLSNLATYYYRIGRNGDAVATEEEAQNIWSKIHTNNNSSSRLSSIMNLAIYYYYNNQVKEAEKNLIYSTNLFDGNIRYSMLQPYKTRQSIWNSCQEWYMNTIPLFAANIQSDTLYEVAYNAALLSKGILLNTEQTLQAMANEDGTHIRELYDEWQNAKLKLDMPHLAEESVKLRIESEEKERLFISECRGLKELTRRLSISWKDVKGRLENSDVAIEFCSYKQGNRIEYIALVITKEMNFPALIHLFSENQLYAIKKNIYTIQSGSKMIWQPIERYLKNVKNIYFSPCGELHNIAIESLPHWSENCLMSDKWHLYRLSSTREIVIANKPKSILKAVVYGGIDYNKSIDMTSESNKLDSNSQSISRTRGGYRPLEGTKKEAEVLCRLLDSVNVEKNLHEGDRATEGTVKNLSGKGFNLLHIGTHGFYFQENETQFWTHLDFLRQNDNGHLYSEDKALTRSGLFFSGANNTWEGKIIPIGVEDGILTAQEISQLDLRGLDLAVLSACDTGLGEIKGDGVFGLQRGFKKAGANSLLMTLWDVEDDATCLLITEFYKNLLSGISKSKSLRQAQIITQKKYPNPEYWAGFILLDAIN